MSQGTADLKGTSPVRRRYVREYQDFDINSKCCPRTTVIDAIREKSLEGNFQLLRNLGTGTYGSVVLACCKKTGTKVALKLLHKSSVKERDFVREFNYSYYLSPHTSVVNTFDVAFRTGSQFVFAQEFAPYGDLFDRITPQIGLTEPEVKLVAEQIASALDFIHSLKLVHRDIKPENVLIFHSELRTVKLTDFGMAKRIGTVVRKVSEGIPYTPPEICGAMKGDRYSVDYSADVWAFGVLLFCCMTGNFPWELACNRDGYFTEYVHWFRKHGHKTPSQWRKFSSRFLKFIKILMHLKPEKRCPIAQVNKVLDFEWTDKSSLVHTDDTKNDCKEGSYHSGTETDPLINTKLNGMSP